MALEPRRQRPTMKDIAELVGVSIKSVSRVLNGEGGVAPATAERILREAENLGFRRNDLASGLRRRDSTNTIGVVAQHTSARFFVSLIQGIEQEAAKHGSLVLTATAAAPEREITKLMALSSLRVDAMVVVPRSTDQAFLRAEQASGLPLVFVDHPPGGLSADTILADNRGGSRMATEHLINHGHRSIAIVGSDPTLLTGEERLIGYREACHSAGLPEGPVRLGCLSSSMAEAQCRELLQGPDRPTAIFALNNPTAIGAARALRALGLQHEAALIGFDDFDTADLFDPPLSVISQDVEHMGRRAVQRLVERLDGDTGPAKVEVLATTLIARGSGEIPGPG